MKDNWLNLGFFDEDLKPYNEPETVIDDKRIGNMSFFVLFPFIVLTLFFLILIVLKLNFCGQEKNEKQNYAHFSY